MQKLWDTYESYEPSGSCGIHAKAIGHVLGEYEGYVHEPIVVTIHEFDEKVVRPSEEIESRQEFHIRVRSKPIKFEQNPDVQVLIRVIIKVRHKKMKGQKVKAHHKHSNLIIIDSKAKKVHRFEPLTSFKFNDQVNDAMEIYFKAGLPDYEYSEINIHPQKVAKKGEKGCHVTSAAYVIKAGVMYALGMSIEFPNEMDSERFATALHHWRDWGSEDHHHHHRRWDGPWYHDERRFREYGCKLEKSSGKHPGIHIETEYGFGWGLLGGAAIGGLVGYQLGKNSRRRERERDYGYGPRYIYTGSYYCGGGWRSGGRHWGERHEGHGGHDH
uniref:Uncharacterized protein n=1 Tax=viral metagenome TaxID=1070528 RepID=A0A6C0CHV3_9ZZZZ